MDKDGRGFTSSPLSVMSTITGEARLGCLSFPSAFLRSLDLARSRRLLTLRLGQAEVAEVWRAVVAVLRA